MNKKVNTFLNSGLLEKYLLGETTAEEVEHVESCIARFPEVQNAYNTLQFNLEVVAKTQAIEAPKSGLSNILEELDNKPVTTLKAPKKHKKWYKYSIAASLTALLFASTSYIFYNQNLRLTQENQVVVDEIFDLRSDINKHNIMLDKMMRQLLKLNNPETEKYIITGNERAKNLKTVAYINAKEKTSMIDIVSLPQLPEEQCYQMWAELQGKMVNLGILDKADRRLRKFTYMEDVQGLSITIEPKGGNNVASKENAVAEISLH